MSVMKTIRTRMTTSPGSLSPIERRVIQTERLLRRAELAQSNTGHSTLADVNLKLEYVGNVPLESGLYFVVDTATQNRNMVRVVVGSGVTMIATRLGESRPESLASFNREEYRWFRVPCFDSADMVEIRKLPVA